MSQSAQAPTQKELIVQKLQAIAPDVTKRDRLSFALHQSVSERTIERYLRGKVSDLDLATEMVVYFSEHIRERATRALLKVNGGEVAA